MRLNRQNKIVVGVIAFILALTVGYALFSETLNINGTAKASGDFDVIFSSVETLDNIIASGKAQGYTNQEGNVLATISEDKHTLELSVNKLDYPGAYIEIPVTIKNTGSIDAVLKGIQTNGLENDDIQVTYTGLVQDEVIKANADPKDITIKVMWKSESTNSNPAVLEFNIELNYVQATQIAGDNPSVNPGTCTAFEKKDTYNVGDTVALCNEQTGVSEDFYVIKDNGSTVTMLSKYNLLVGNNVTGFDGERYETITPIDESVAGYGLQSKDAKGAVVTITGTGESDMVIDPNVVGAVPFADKLEDHKRNESCSEYGCYYGYWTDTSGNLLEKYGTDYPVEVYDNNSKLFTYVNNYNNYIKNTLTKNSSTARLITQNELVELGCSSESGTCPADKSFLYETTYWTGTAGSSDDVWDVNSYGGFGGNHFDSDYILGVRPVITISKSDI